MDGQDRANETDQQHAPGGPIANPLRRLPFGAIASTTIGMVGRVLRDSGQRTEKLSRLRRDLSEIARGESDVAPTERDARFTDTAWQTNPAYRRLMQTYLVLEREIEALPDEAGLDGPDARRGRFVASVVADAIAPTNALIGNPAAIKRAIDTGGGSLVAGVRNYVDDIRHNGGLPRMVDTSPFEVGVNLAATPGSVIHRSDLVELIQYRPTTGQVHKRPVLIVPPELNRFYVLDLAPGRSMVEHLVSKGHQVFMISWRNPTPEHRDWGLEHYVLEIAEAIRIVDTFNRADRINILGACAGGVTTAYALAYLAGRGEDLVESITFLVTVLDSHADSAASLFDDDGTMAAAMELSRRKGIIDGDDIARMFTWLRPNDLVWNYWVNNYLMGRRPPAFDVLAWNADHTNLPAALHADFLSSFKTNALANPGTVEIDSIPIDARSIEIDSFLIGATTDHITPWKACYASASLIGGQPEFILSSSGHIQCLVNPPGTPRSSFLTNDELPSTPDEWLATATRRSGSWWDYWVDWLDRRGGGMRRAPSKLGNKTYPAGVDAPGTYVRT